MRAWLVNSGLPIVVAIVFALAITAVTMRSPAQPAIEVHPPELVPTPTALLYVHVDGAVAAPGVYELATGSRVFEAIDAAGGATDDADTAGLNLAAKIADGQKLVVPLRRASADLAAPASPASPSDTSQAQSVAGGATININTASPKMLDSLPGVGAVTANKIIARRTSTGPFTRIEQLRDEKIVNASTYERIKTLISVE